MSATDLDPHRLPHGVRPVRYEVRLAPDLERHSFDGDVSIEIEVEATAEVIVLNAADLEIGNASLSASANDSAVASSALHVVLDEATERLLLTPAAPLEPGRFTLEIAFKGTLNDQLRGFYRSTYVDDVGDEATIATTQFQSTDARRAFPCWDEPEAKAVFSITLDVAEGLTAISNGPEIDRQTLDDGAVRHVFADTMPMSTYLVAMVVGDLEVSEGPTSADVPLRVVHRPGAGAQTAFALEVAAFALDWFAEWYGIPYPDAKVDLVAVPDFAMGAMENLGCVTFRETLLLVDPERVTRPELQRVVDVICHELAHMWFGDLVTMKWWNGIWLNEAFATFMEVSSCDAFRPEWRRWEAFCAERTAAFEVDGLHSTRPIEFPVGSPAEAEAMFDVLTYEKGAAVVRMLEHYVGPGPFKQGIRTYLDRHRYANTDTADLWDALTAETGVDVGGLMDTWILRRGHPLVTLERTGPTTATLNVERFTFMPSPQVDPEPPTTPVFMDAIGETGERTSWSILVGGSDGEAVRVTGPQGLAAAARRTPRGWSVDLVWTTSPGSLLLNAGARSFHRSDHVGSDADLMDRASQLTAAERYGILDDAWALVRAGRSNLERLLAVVRALAGSDTTIPESDPAVIRRLVAIVLDLVDLSPERETAAAWARSLLGPLADDLGTDPADGESVERGEARGAVLAALGSLDCEQTVDLARDRCAAHLGGAELPPPLAAAAIDTAARHANGALVDALLERYETCDDPQDGVRCLQALAGVADTDLMATVLDALLGRVRSQDAPFVIRRALANHQRQAQVWAFVNTHWDQLVERFPSSTVARMLEGISSVGNAVLADEIRDFLETQRLEGREQPIAQHLERMAIRVSTARRLRTDLSGLRP